MFITEIFLLNEVMRKITFSLLTVFVLSILILAGCKSVPQADELEIINPVFEVVSIAVIQADIVVTEFETILKITNPNNFALDLKYLTYELLGKGASWAKGSVKNILHVPADSFAETKFTFQMNFINMSRSLLDDVIAMRQVQYRFRGNAEVHPMLPRVESFIVSYDRSGLSEVKRK